MACGDRPLNPSRLRWPALPDALTQQGWDHHPSFLAPSLQAALRRWGDTQRAALKQAGTGQGAAYRAHSVRGDRILWLDLAQGTAVERRLGRQLDALRQHLNQSLFMNLVDVEAHLAVYAPGQAYARHRDRFRHDDRRQVSWVGYLNEDWSPEAGGALRLHVPDGPVDVLPQSGAAVTFLSGDIEHEVCSATRERWSVAAWFRTR